MKNQIKITLLTSFVAFFSSCMDVIDIELNNKESIVTVDAIIDDLHQDQVVRLTKTDNYFSENVPPAIHDAKVTLNDLDNNRSYSFNHVGNGDYVYKVDSDDTIVFKNHNYELIVEIGSFKYRSTTSYRRSAQIEALYYDSVVSGSSVIGAKGLKLLARDMKGPVADFYWIKSYLNGRFLNKTNQIKLEYFGFHNELDGGYFNPMIWSNPGQDSDDKNLKKGDKIRVDVLGVNRETYDFLSLGKQMSNNGGLFATSAVNLPSNIHAISPNTPRATGVFCISEVSSREITIN